MTDFSNFHVLKQLSQLYPDKIIPIPKHCVPKHLRLNTIKIIIGTSHNIHLSGLYTNPTSSLLTSITKDTFYPSRATCHITLSHITSIITLSTINAILALPFKTLSHKNTFFILFLLLLHKVAKLAP